MLTNRLILSALLVSLTTACASQKSRGNREPEAPTTSVPVQEKTPEVTPAEAVAMPQMKPPFKALENNLIQCSGTQGQMVDRCKLDEKEIAPVQEKLSTFFVSYTMTCNRSYTRPTRSDISLRLENGQETFLRFNEKSPEINVGTGKGPLILSDTLPKSLSSMRFNDCQLSIDSIRIAKVILED